MSYSKRAKNNKITNFDINDDDLIDVLHNFYTYFDKINKQFKTLYSYDSEDDVLVFKSNSKLYYRYVQVSRRYYNNKTNNNIFSKFYNLKTDNDISFTQGRMFEIETNPIIEFDLIIPPKTTQIVQK